LGGIRIKSAACARKGRRRLRRNLVKKIPRHCKLWNACLELVEGSRFPGCRRRQVEWPTVSRAMITIILSDSVFRVLTIFLRRMIPQRYRRIAYLFGNVLDYQILIG